MKIRIVTLVFTILQLSYFAQVNFPNPIEFNKFEYLDKAKQKVVYDFSKNEKKAFLFFDMKSDALAEVMYNGANFIFNGKNISIFPIYFAGQLTKKHTEDFSTKIPTQLYRTPLKSIFNKFNLTEADFPLLVVYNEKNELCGFSKNVEGISSIDCGQDQVSLKVLRLKIMTEEKNKELLPYAHKEVFIIGGDKNDTVAKLVTNKYGDFNAEIPDVNQDYLIKVNEVNKTMNFVVLATQSGKEVGKFQATEGGFVYRLLKTDVSTLSDIEIDDDVEMKFAVLKNKALNNFSITETLYYELGESKLTEGSKELLLKVKTVLDSYPEFQLLVISHTDSQGDDQSNLKLSVKRSEAVNSYLVSLGIDKSRLNAEGKGELEIRNRCVNNVDCSDKEHEYNRRTEFKFTKK